MGSLTWRMDSGSTHDWGDTFCAQLAATPGIVVASCVLSKGGTRVDGSYRLSGGPAYVFGGTRAIGSVVPPAPPPGPAPSPDGTLIDPAPPPAPAPPPPSLVDAHGVRWSIRTFALRDGKATNGHATQIWFDAGDILVKSPTGGIWWEWHEPGTWVSTGISDMTALIRARRSRPPPIPTGSSPPDFSTTPTINGTPQVGVASSYISGTVTGSPLPTITRQWMLDGADIAGATGTTYTPVTGDATHLLQVREVAVNTFGSDNSTSVSATVLSATTAPAFSTAPAINGTPQVGVASSYAPGTVTGSPTPTITQRWTLDGVDITGAVNATYTPITGQETHALRVREIATNSVSPFTASSTSAPKTVLAAAVAGGTFVQLGTQTLGAYLTVVRTAMAEGYTSANNRMLQASGIMMNSGAMIWRDQYTLPIQGGHGDSHDDGGYAQDLITGAWQTLITPSTLGMNTDVTNAVGEYAATSGGSSFIPGRPASQHSCSHNITVGDDIIQTCAYAAGNAAASNKQAHRLNGTTKVWSLYGTGGTHFTTGIRAAFYHADTNLIARIPLLGAGGVVETITANDPTAVWTTYTPSAKPPLTSDVYGSIGFHPGLNCYVWVDQHDTPTRDKVYVLDRANLTGPWVECTTTGTVPFPVSQGGLEYIPPMGGFAMVNFAEADKLYYLIPTGAMTAPWAWTSETFTGSFTTAPWMAGGVPGTPFNRVRWSTLLNALVMVKDVGALTEVWTPGGIGAPPPSVVVSQVQLDISRLVVLEAFSREGRYERFQRLFVLSGTTGSLTFHGFDQASGGLPRDLLGTTYSLLLSTWNGTDWGTPAVAATVNVAAAIAATPGLTLNGRFTFSFSLANVAHGWHKIAIDGLAGGETAPIAFTFVNKLTPPGVQPFIPVVIGSQGLELIRTDIEQYVLAPGIYAPTPKPILTKRNYLPPATLNVRAGLHIEQLVPAKWGDIHRTNRNYAGIDSSFDRQAYEWSTMHAEEPLVACLDGPRGVGTVTCPTHLVHSAAIVNGVQIQTTYFSDPWRVGKITEDGTIKTLVGWRHKDNILGHWEDAIPTGNQTLAQAIAIYKANSLELVGDWSAIPAAVQGFWEIWGFAFDERTFALDPNAPPIGGLQPHLAGPAMYVADSQRNRICKVEFSATSFTAPAVVTEFLTGLADPWDCVAGAGKLYVSERKAHRIAEYDIDTGVLSRVLVEGQWLATIDVNREVIATASLAERQAADCVAPEGLFLQDGWVYYGSKAMAQIKRVNITTGVIEVSCQILIDGNSKFAKIAVSDGTIGPRGMTAVSTWSNVYYGFPILRNPDGTPLKNIGGGVGGAAPGGTGDWTKEYVYGTASSLSHGQMVFGGMSEGIGRVTKTQAGDLAETAAATRGRADYITRGFNLIYGQDGFGFYGLEMPWGTTADIDAYLTLCGHLPP